MKVILAKPRGFCAGVKRAIAIVNQALEQYGTPVFVLHEIVHNTHVIHELSGKGAVFVENLEDIPTGSITVFSAHGVSKSIKKRAKQLDLKTVNATCPLVTRVHRRVSRLNKTGCDVLVIGHKGHPEVIGTCGHADGSVHVVSTPAEVEKLKIINSSRVGYVTQTTLSIDDTREMLTAIRRKFPKINEPERTDICYATTNRQAAVHRLAGMSDLVLVVGSKNSSNSNRLRETAANCAVPAYLIDQASEINQNWLTGKNTIGISAGASAPEHLINGLISYLRNLGADNIEEMDGDDENFSFQPPKLHW